MSRPAPFSLRLTEDERQRLETQAGGMPLASYIKSVVFAEDAPKHRARRRPPVAEQQLLAEVLARLGQTQHANNLNQIAKHLNQGTLMIDPELEVDLNRAFAEIAWMRVTLMQALEKLS
ncbi:MobC family plasmid mobilization relaxosome protein [Cochlodiniinecator piscidefendens]|uniref:MobC family plasmid mobilization relaxosome protein n=1 Tax=Cochlodiniinecator piscidefendens TaxID=2715756 RepID=UPI001E5B2E9E|nr:MobC family plasmid mobilization relaxosome protein [Cochlodiniinecator piscidefendens]